MEGFNKFPLCAGCNQLIYADTLRFADLYGFTQLSSTTCKQRLHRLSWLISIYYTGIIVLILSLYI